MVDLNRYQDALDGAVRRLEQHGLIRREPVSGHAGMTGDALMVLADLTVLLTAQTAGDDQPPTTRLAHEVGHIYREALAALTGDLASDVTDDEVAVHRDAAVELLVEIARRHRDDDGGPAVAAPTAGPDTGGSGAATVD